MARLRARQPTDKRPVPVAASPDVAAAAGPGGVVALDFGSARLVARVVATLRRAPTVDGNVVLADESTAATALTADSPGAGAASEVWIDAPSGSEGQLETALARPPFDALQMTFHRRVLDDLRSEPLARGTLITLTAGAATALAVALAGVLLGLLSDLRDERGELFDLEAQGAEPATLRRHLRLRTALVAAVGVIGGLSSGPHYCADRGARDPDGERRPPGAAAPPRRRLAGARARLTPVRGDRGRRRRSCDASSVPCGRRRPLRGGRDVSDAIEIRDLFRVHQTAEGDAAALQGLSLAIREREVVTVLGPSGSGKTTLLRILAGLDRPSAGTVRVFGTELGKLPARGRRALPNADDRLCRPALRAGAVARADGARTRRAGARPCRRPAQERLRRADELLERVGLADKRDARPDELSGGEQQRVAVAASVAHRPRLFLADEPTGELDAASAALVYATIGDLVRAERCTAVIVSHDPASTEIADRIVHDP